MSQTIAERLARALGGDYEQAVDEIVQMAANVDCQLSCQPFLHKAVESNQFKFWDQRYDEFIHGLELGAA